MAPSGNRLPKKARLRHRRLIEPLFKRDDASVKSRALGCVRIVYRVIDRSDAESHPVQAGFAPGRIKGAVNRNRVKRQLREVYRQHQQRLVDLFSRSDSVLTMMVLFRGRPEDAGTCVRSDLPALLDGLAGDLEARAAGS